MIEINEAMGYFTYIVDLDIEKAYDSADLEEARDN